MKMKKVICLVLAVLTIVVFVVACDMTTEPDPTITENVATNAPASTEPKPAGNLDDCNIIIKDALVVKQLGTLDPADVVIVTYEFTNCSKEAKEFGWMVTHTVFQGGVECEQYYAGELLLDDDLKYDSKTMTKVQPNVPIEVKVMYKLNDLTTPIDVVCSSYLDFSSDPATVERTFTMDN